MRKQFIAKSMAFIKQDEFNILGYHLQKKTLYKFVVVGWVAKALVTVLLFKVFL